MIKKTLALLISSLFVSCYANSTTIKEECTDKCSFEGTMHLGKKVKNPHPLTPYVKTIAYDVTSETYLQVDMSASHLFYADTGHFSREAHVIVVFKLVLSDGQHTHRVYVERDLLDDQTFSGEFTTHMYVVFERGQEGVYKLYAETVMIINDQHPLSDVSTATVHIIKHHNDPQYNEPEWPQD